MHSTALQQLQETSAAHAALLMQARALAAFSNLGSGGLTYRIVKLAACRPPQMAGWIKSVFGVSQPASPVQPQGRTGW